MLISAVAQLKDAMMTINGLQAHTQDQAKVRRRGSEERRQTQAAKRPTSTSPARALKMRLRTGEEDEQCTTTYINSQENHALHHGWGLKATTAMPAEVHGFHSNSFPCRAGRHAFSTCFEVCASRAHVSVQHEHNSACPTCWRSVPTQGECCICGMAAHQRAAMSCLEHCCPAVPRRLIPLPFQSHQK